MTAQADSASLVSRSPAMARAQLRRQLRAARAAVTSGERRRAARRIAMQLERSGWLMPGRRIGVYLALPEELSLTPTIERAWARGCRVFVPHITHVRQRRMVFLPFKPNSRLTRQQWGVRQLALQRHYQPVPIATLDVLLVPLVGFDRHGQRLGMGAGFYDRLLASRIRPATLARPRLIGIALLCQGVPLLPHAEHDVPMDAILTERGFHRPS